METCPPPLGDEGQRPDPQQGRRNEVQGRQGQVPGRTRFGFLAVPLGLFRCLDFSGCLSLEWTLRPPGVGSPVPAWGLGDDPPLVHCWTQALQHCLLRSLAGGANKMTLTMAPELEPPMPPSGYPGADHPPPGLQLVPVA